MSEMLNERGFPVDWAEDYHRRIGIEQPVSSWRHENGEPLTEEEQAQATQSLAERREEIRQQYGPSTGFDKGEHDE